MDVTYSDLAGKKVLITGATRGIGKDIALALAQQKVQIIFNYRSDTAVAEDLKATLLAAGAEKVYPLAFDITDTATMKEVLTNFTKEHGTISGLINNAGISKDTLVLRLKEEELSRILDTNLKATIMLTQILTRNFLKAENVSIINMSSIVGLMGNTAQVAYAASKAGIIGFTKSYAKELASKNIRCNAICPGFIETEMTEKLEEKTRENYYNSIPLKRFGSTKEVANLTLFLLSQASSYITGETIKIDGGLYT